jgi:flagellar hook-associated protein FlgK
MLDIIQGIEDYLINKEIYDVNDLVGSLKNLTNQIKKTNSFNDL